MHFSQLRARLQFILHELDRNAALIPGNSIYTKLDMIWCGIRYGAAPSNYVNFEFHRIGSRDRKTFVTHRISEKLMHRYNDPADLDLLRNKLKFSQKFASHYGRKCISSADCTAEFLSKYAGEKIIYKPLRGGQGQGIAVFTVSDPESLARQIRTLPNGVIETWIRQHPHMNTLYPDAINPIRIQTICHAGTVECLCATVTAGCGSHFANASSHALFALVDVKNGTVITDGCDYSGNFYTVHPTTGTAFRGFLIPNWAKLLDTVTSAAMDLPTVGYIGWDVAITEDGCVLIEGNNDPGYTAYQLPRLTGTHTGTLELYKPYL